MSDRVAIIGGSIVGRDHFPFPVPDVDLSEVGMGTVYPVGMTLEDVCLMFYLVKEWEIDINITRTVPPFPPDNVVDVYHSQAGALMINDVVVGDFFPYDRESDLVVPRMTLGESSVSTSNFGTFADADEYSNPTGFRAVANGGLIYPMFFIEAQAGDGPSSDFSPTPPSSAVTLEILSYTATLVAVESGWSGLISIQPTEYWSYSTKDGQPVYDTSDGSIINDPLS